MTVLQCDACAARDRKVHVVSSNRDPGDPPAGLYFAIHDEED